MRDIRNRFNRGRFWERAQAGELGVRVRDSYVPRRRIKGEPSRTKTQMVEYLDPVTGRLVALVHQYRRPDGSLGGSGRPDPKELLDDDGCLYYIDPTMPDIDPNSPPST